MEQGEIEFERRPRATADVEFDGTHETAELVRASELGGLKCHASLLALIGAEQERLIEMALRVREDWLLERKILQQCNRAEWAPLVLEVDTGKQRSACRLRWKVKPYGKYKGSVPARGVSRPGEIVVGVFNLLRHSKPWEIDLTILTETRCARIRLAWKHMTAFKGLLLTQPRQMVARIEKGELAEARSRRLRIVRS